MKKCLIVDDDRDDVGDDLAQRLSMGTKQSPPQVRRTVQHACEPAGNAQFVQ